MPTVHGTDLFYHNDFTVPGGGPYVEVGGTPERDLTVLRAGDPASLLISTGATVEQLGSQLTTPLPVRGWHGFAWRLNSADVPASQQVVARLWTAGFGTSAGLNYLVATQELEHFLGANTARIAVSLNVWNWVEQIFDVSGTTYTSYTQVNGVDLTSVTTTSTASTVEYTYLQGYSTTWRFSRHMWGAAASTTDWHGDPNAPFRADYSKFPKAMLRR